MTICASASESRSSPATPRWRQPWSCHDTVNLASRMESSGLPGRIQVAPSTWALLREHHTFDAREPMEVKGLGPMTTYLLADG